MDQRTLIVAKTSDEARDHALAFDLRDWLFVSGPWDLIGAHPATHVLEFVGRWYERRDLKSLRLRICGRGFNTPQLKQAQGTGSSVLVQRQPGNGAAGDIQSDRGSGQSGDAYEHS